MDAIWFLFYIFAGLSVAVFLYFFVIPYFKRMRNYYRAYRLIKKVQKTLKKIEGEEKLKNDVDEIAQGIKGLIKNEKL